MKQAVTKGMIQPLLRRMASITSNTRAMPKNTSQGKGVVLRSPKSSPPRIKYTTTATDRTVASKSHHMMRWRYFCAMGKTRKLKPSTKPTWMGRSHCVEKTAYAVYRWKADINTATRVMQVATQPLNLLAAPSSASTNSSAFFSASALTASGL